jgi:hypothetical protein
MSAAELAFEVMAAALETVRGTAITPPTHILNVTGMITPIEEEYFPEDQVGHLSEYERSEIVRKSAEWEAEGGADVTKLPLLANMVFAPLTTGVAAGGEVTSTTSLVGGSGYVPATQTDAFAITVGAPAAGGRQAVIYATTSAGVITSLRIADPGSNYTSAPALTFTGHTGTGASATAVVSAVGTIAKQWEFIRGMTTDAIKTATMYWGDPNAVVYKSPFGVATEMTLSGDASSTDGVTSSIKGIAQFPTELTGGSIPAMPTVAVSPLLVPSAMQLWLEPNTTNAFGTTAVTGRVVSAEYTVPTGAVAKFVATGPAGGITYDHIGRTKAHPELKVVFEMTDTTQSALFMAGTSVKVRVAFNNTTAIETTIYPAVKVDIQGKLGQLSWGDLEGANRTVEFTISGVYSTQLASDARMIVVNSSAVL